MTFGHWVLRTPWANDRQTLKINFRYKVILGIAVIELVMFLALITNDLKILVASHKDIMQDTIDTTLASFTSATYNAIVSTDTATLDELTARLSSTPIVAFVRIDNSEGITLSASKDDTYQGHDITRVDKHFEDSRDGVFHTATPITSGIGPIATLYTGFHVAKLQATREAARTRAVRIAGLGLMLSAIFSYVLGTLLSRRLELLRIGAEKIASGDYTGNLPEKGRDEIAQVTRAFNTMAIQLRSAMAASRKYENNLKTLNAELEQRVTRRTTQLQSANDELQQVAETLQQERDEQKILIQKLQAAQNLLLQSEKMASVGQLAAGVAHEINNPVGYISSNIDSLNLHIKDLFRVLEAYERLEEQVRNEPGLAVVCAIKDEVDLTYLKQDIVELIGESQEGIMRVKQIVQDLKYFSHADESDWQWADLHKGLDSTLNVASSEIKYKADVIKEYGDIPPVECIPSQLNQVFMNLLVNAAHAIEERGVITIRTGCEDNQVRVSISDTGKGIPEAILNRIFDPFFTTKPVGQGTGLGLSLSYGIIEKHGGRIDVHSEEGQGTTFTIRVPVEQTHYMRKVTSE